MDTDTFHYICRGCGYERRTHDRPREFETDDGTRGFICRGVMCRTLLRLRFWGVGMIVQGEYGKLVRY